MVRPVGGRTGGGDLSEDARRPDRPPLRKVEIADTRGDVTGISFARPVLFTPTFVLVEDGRELARIEGYPGEDFFWGGLLGGLLAEHLGFQPVQG